jgi:di/tricarboxylate transporter
MHPYLLLFAGVGILLIAIGTPLARRNIPPNHWYGFRIRATFADPDVWYETNATAGRDMIRLGILVAVLSAVLPFVVRLRDADYAGIMAATVGAGSIILTIRGFLLANRLLRERRGR